MAENFSRKVFYDRIRESIYGGAIATQRTVQGINAILDACARFHITSLAEIAVILGNVRLEVGEEMYPVREGFKSTDAGAIAHVTQMFREGRISKNYALADPVNGLSHYGRGQIQLTHAYNYKGAGKRLGVDFYNFPDKVLQVEYSAQIAVLGHIEGWWRGDRDGDRHKLSRYVKGDKLDFQGLRRIVNGDNRHGDLEFYTDLFWTALIKAAEYPADEPEPSKPDKGDQTMSGFFSRLFGGTNGDNLIRVLFGSILGAVGIETGAGGDIPGVDLTQMGFAQIMPMLMIYLLFEKLGIDRKATPAPDQGGE